MTTIVYLAPLLAMVSLLVFRRTTLLRAGLVGLALVVPGILLALPGDTHVAHFVARESAKGVWIAWHAVSVIAAGLFFHNVIKLANPKLFETGNGASGFSYRALFAFCFLLGPFFETTVSFGMGIVILIPLLRRMDIPPIAAVAFSLISQILVPWGALGVGTIIGAGIAGVSLAELGVRSAILSAPLLFGDLLVFWVLAAREGWNVSPAQRLDDVLWITALAAMLYLANRYIAVETSVLTATGALLVLRYWRDMRPAPSAWRRMLGHAAPYAVLTGILLATRAFPGAAESLRKMGVWQPAGDFPAFPVFYHVSFWLLIAAVLFGAARRFAGNRWRAAFAATWSNAKTPIAVTLIYVVMAQLMGASGIAAKLAQSWASMTGDYAIFATPVFAAIAGFLTGSNIGSNAMVMPIQSGLASHGQYDLGWIAALQNTTGSNFTMLSAARVAMGCSLLGNKVSEHAVYARGYLLGVAAILIMGVVPLFL